MASFTHERETSGYSWDHEEDSATKTEASSEVTRVLEVKRWEVQEGPFRGFNSPPGRF